MLWIFPTIYAVVLQDCCTSPGLIALTFDDGPTGYTSDLLEELDNLDCKATFHFTTHNRARGNIRNVYSRAVEEGHCVGVRMHPGRDFGSMSPDELDEEVKNQLDSINNATGEKIKYARAPVQDGDVNTDLYNSLMKQNVTQTGYSYCLYDDATNTEDAIATYKQIINESNPKYDSFIFLLHDEKEREMQLVTDMVEIGRKKGYEFVTMDQCLKGYDPADGTVEGRRKKKGNGIGPLMILPVTIMTLLTL